jgi:RHS repeat-associated protein
VLNDYSSSALDSILVNTPTWDSDGFLVCYLPDVQTYSDFSPYGTLLAGRNGSTATYLYGFNGKQEDSEIKGEGNSYDFGARMYDPRVGRWLSGDPKESKFPALSPYVFVYNSPVYFIDPNGEEPTPMEAALLAKHVYGGADSKIELTGGWQISNRQFDQKITYNYEPTGFQSKLYERVDAEGNVIEYAYVTAGTNDWKDALVDVGQLVGVTVQYQMSVENAINISEELGEDVELTFVGHSLGGGLAAANAYAAGRRAITFNPAALSEATKLILGITVESFLYDGDVQNYVVFGEIVSLTNINGTDGSTDFLFYEEGWSSDPITKHTIDYVIKALKSYGTSYEQPAKTTFRANQKLKKQGATLADN